MKKHYQKTKEFHERKARENRGMFDPLGSLPARAQERVKKIALEFLRNDPLNSEAGKIKKGDFLLDAGCAAGSFSAILAQKYPQANIVGNDFSDEMLRIAIQRYKKIRNLKFQKASLLNLVYPKRKFRVSFCLDTLHHILPEDLVKVLGNLASITQDVLILEIKNKNAVKKISTFLGGLRSINIYPTSSQEVNQMLSQFGYYLQKEAPILGLKFLSPMSVLKFKRSTQMHQYHKLHKLREDNVRIELLKKEDEETWDGFVLKHPHATFYHQIGYKLVIEKIFGHRSICLIAKQKDKIVGILPLFEVKSRFFPSCLVSLPFTGYGGALAVSPKIKAELIQKAKEILKKENLDYLMLREIHSSTVLGASPRRASLILRLEDEDKLWQKIGSKTRNLIKKAKKFNLKTKIGKDQLDNFYQVWSENRRDLGTPALNKDFFENLIDTFPQKINILTVLLKNQPVAGMFLVGFRENIEGLYAGSPRRFREYVPNMFLYWQAFLYGLKSGYKNFDFSPSTTDASHFRFKEQFNGQVVPVEYRIYSRKGIDLSPTELKSNQKYRLLRKAWQQLPLSVANFLGPYFSKDIP